MTKKIKKAVRRIRQSFGKLGTLNIVLICVFLYTVHINQQMIDTYRLYGSAPETAWCALIAALIGECGICGWIKTSKEKHKYRSRDEPDGNTGDVEDNNNMDLEETEGKG